jgi:Uncharacterised nucleotidyltransferase
MTRSSEHLRLAAFGFGVDLVTAEVTVALEAESIPSILLKGPVIATWLYREDESRLYGDTDLLLRECDWERAIEVLEGRGFEDDLSPLAHPRMESATGHPMNRAVDGAAVDLHLNLFGVGAAPSAVWEAFSEGAVRQVVGGAEVSMPPHPVRLLHIALHAVQHGGDFLPKAMHDLRRAIARVPESTWREARDLAVRIEAEGTFAVGLRLTPEGSELAATIGVSERGSEGSILRMARVPTAEGFFEISRAPGLRGKLALALRELFPNPAFMRWWTPPLARRGRRGLLAAYGWRLIWLGYRAIPGYRAWRRAVRQASGE